MKEEEEREGGLRQDGDATIYIYRRRAGGDATTRSLELRR